MDGFPSGQRGQTVNLLQIASVVRIHLHPLIHNGGVSSLEARRLITEGRRFKSCPRNFAWLAQLVEQRTENPRVSGSIPEPGILSEKTEWGISSVGRALDF